MASCGHYAAVTASEYWRERITLGQTTEIQVLRKGSSMQEYDFYFNPQKPTLGLYVRTGAGLPDLADPRQWVFEITLAGNELPREIVHRINTDGHAFQELD